MIKLIQCIARKSELSVPEFRSRLVEYRDRVQRLADALDAVRVTVCPTLQVEQNLEIMLSRGTSEPFDAVVAIWLERAPDLAADIGVGPSALGLLTSVYFITFASFQLPLGVLLDRYGPRKTEAVLLMFAAFGAFLFSRADSLTPRRC